MSSDNTANPSLVSTSSWSNISSGGVNVSGPEEELELLDEELPEEELELEELLEELDEVAQLISVAKTSVV